jgi:hypothetical protein
MRVRAWLERNEVVLKATAACIVAITAGAWALVELVYSDLIRPRLQAPQIDTEMASREVGRTEQYTVHELSFKFTNRGLNRIYVPSSYFLAKAYNVSKVRVQKEKDKTEEEKLTKLKAAISKYWDNLSREEKWALKAQASNMLIKNEWPQLLSKDGLSGVADLRSSYGFDDKSFLYVHLGRLIGLTDILDPGEVTTGQVLLYVPIGYQALEVISNTILSKDSSVFSKYVFIGVPDDKKGLLMLALDGTKPTEPQISQLRKTIKENLNSGFYTGMEERLRDSEVFNDARRLQIHIAPAQQGAPADASTSALLSGRNKAELGR